jgi:hypothetical protein
MPWLDLSGFKNASWRRRFLSAVLNVANVEDSSLNKWSSNKALQKKVFDLFVPFDETSRHEKSISMDFIVSGWLNRCLDLHASKGMFCVEDQSRVVTQALSLAGKSSPPVWLAIYSCCIWPDSDRLFCSCSASWRTIGIDTEKSYPLLFSLFRPLVAFIVPTLSSFPGSTSIPPLFFVLFFV